MAYKTLKLASKHWCKNELNSDVHVVLPSFKPVLQKSGCGRPVALTLTSDWIKLRGSHGIHGSCVTCCKKVCLGPVKRATCTDFVAKNRTTLYFPQQLFAACNNLICCKTGWNLGGKTHNNVFQLAGMLQNKLQVFVSLFTVS